VGVIDEAILTLKQMIVSGELQPGDRLPREAELAAQLGLSRNSLREAIRALALVNVLDSRQGDGTYVTSLRAELLLEAVTFIIDFHRDSSVLHFLQARRILEPAATALAAARISETEVTVLSGLIEGITPDTPVDERVARDVEFHRRICTASGNVVLASLVDSLTAPTTRARVWRGLTDERSFQRTLEEHRAIVQALRSRAVDVAHAWAHVHIAGVETWLRRAL
jgi:DNA-binding FadR family transcriptional regulator